ncbi:putative cyclin-dependent kinase F-2 [Panicum virgatum]|uniref:[RNA-polymerase]-subunit kinase n=1 Tax=Panicum virgatum TaxID=38727 RepID=A0A8T0TQT7_PANVG|nr:putative cyclin-dependent kinase F-2 [Panicum virgatum]KAG2611415.1 hypothetical protein PVAP13_4KG164500 [Panicum virgatum]
MSAAEVETVAASVTDTVAARLAAICDMIQGHRASGTPISARRAAAISAMIDDVAATAAEGRPRAFRQKRRMASARGYKQEGRRLGQQGGSGGVVVMARHRATGRAVAVKSLHRRSGGSYVGDVLREACFTAAGGGHPSLVTFRTVARKPSTTDYSIVTDYVGPSLRAVMGDRGGRPFPEAEVRRIMRQLLAGAAAMHGRGIVHRDVRPDNILVGDGGAVKICNYGAAKSMAEKDPPCYDPAGTCVYVAPEVLVKNADHGELVDSWSLGCVMAELLTGKPPFAGEDEAHQLFKIFDVVGVPCRRAWQALKPQVHDDKVQLWRARQHRRVGLGPRNRLHELIPEETLSGEGFQVLKGLLSCDPEKRLTTATALQCPWFTEDDDDAPVSGRIITVSKIGSMASKSLLLAMSSIGCALAGLLRPKALRL